ncbi:MAG TPA: sulfite exporter TauE/SafE family protein, partial [Actinomycetota bacterium]|nr:sulfite exporter TauE/SafE family protein [Actinomycetota bacterium]
MAPQTIALLLAAGFVAGFINTVAGGGSAITLTVLESLLGPTVANGTNRVAVFLANGVAVAGFARGDAVPWKRALPLIPPTVVGAGIGAWTATRLSNQGMRTAFAFALLFVAVSVLVKPSRWTQQQKEPVLHEPWRSLAFLGVGFYGGFVQAGVGFLILLAVVMGGGLDLVRGNAAKVLLILSYTPVALLLFARAAQVDVKTGLVLAAGNTSGAWVAARLAVRRGAGWIRWVLVFVAVAAAVWML